MKKADSHIVGALTKGQQDEVKISQLSMEVLVADASELTTHIVGALTKAANDEVMISHLSMEVLVKPYITRPVLWHRGCLGHCISGAMGGYGR